MWLLLRYEARHQTLLAAGKVLSINLINLIKSVPTSRGHGLIMP